ncbi:Radical SAM superfamily enzyme YgiQ, UPF0313 family [Micromonospora echinospora]|uniref:Radical SAM superfamily enzyme YgiQ, UPF0313 family n=1 Tax=Micromonospora echinospora TaxID=1877 RepID=A0A1C4WLU9_MICEC|nr:radical SAM protein [Micromonospora echinospora]SCE97192.1 Radical SAM superfamily enzyme YgiQ, UPF0313 family [Micromonospora echinospora]
MTVTNKIVTGVAFPPSLLAETPPISVATLTAYLRDKGMPAVGLDLNADFNEYLLNRVEIEQVQGPENTHEFTKPFIKQFFLNHITGNYFTETNFEQWDLQQQCQVAPESLSIWDPPFPFSYCEFLSILRDEPERVAKLVRDPDANIYHAFYQEKVAGKASELGLMGFSIMGYNQVIPALTLGYLMKKENPDLYICWGGPWVTSFADMLIPRLEACPELGELIDALVVREGEEPLLKMAEALSRGERPVGIPGGCKPMSEQSVLDTKPVGRKLLLAMSQPRENMPNTHWRIEDGTYERSGDISWVADMNQLPTPDYSDFDLSLYTTFREGQGSLVLQGSRSCYYMKCSFCNAITNFAPWSYRERSTENIQKDIDTFLELYPGTVHFDFADAVFPAKRLVELADFFIEKKRPELFWEVDVRFEGNIDKAVLTKMRDSQGTLRFGLETANERLLDLVRKGNRMEVVHRLLQDSRELGYKPFLMTIVGLPTEEREEAEELYQFLSDYHDTVTYQIADFIVERNSPIQLRPDDYGIHIDDDEQESFHHNLHFTRRAGYSDEEAQEVYRDILVRTMQRFKGAHEVDVEQERSRVAPDDSVYRLSLRAGSFALENYWVKHNNLPFEGLVPIGYKVQQQWTDMTDKGTVFEIDPDIALGALAGAGSR